MGRRAARREPVTRGRACPSSVARGLLSGWMPSLSTSVTVSSCAPPGWPTTASSPSSTPPCTPTLAAGVNARRLDRRPLRGRPSHVRARAGRHSRGGHGDRPDRFGAVPDPPAVDLRRGHLEGRPTRAHRDPPGLPPPGVGTGPVRRRPRVEPAAGHVWQFISGIPWYYRQFGYTYGLDLPSRPVLWLAEPTASSPAPEPPTHLRRRASTGCAPRPRRRGVPRRRRGGGDEWDDARPWRGAEGFELELARRPGGLVACDVLVIESTAPEGDRIGYLAHTAGRRGPRDGASHRAAAPAGAGSGRPPRR